MSGPAAHAGRSAAAAPLIFVMHSFIDADAVGPTWDLVRSGGNSDGPRIRKSQARGPARPENDWRPAFIAWRTRRAVSGSPACMQHSVLPGREQDPPHDAAGDSAVTAARPPRFGRDNSGETMAGAQGWMRSDVREATRTGLLGRYGHGARWYDRLSMERTLYREGRVAMVEHLGLRPGDRVLDVGCGTGLSLPLLVAAVGAQGQVVGVEPSEPMLAQARLRVQRGELRHRSPGPPVGLRVAIETAERPLCRRHEPGGPQRLRCGQATVPTRRSGAQQSSPLPPSPPRTAGR